METKITGASQYYFCCAVGLVWCPGTKTTLSGFCQVTVHVDLKLFIKYELSCDLVQYSTTSHIRLCDIQILSYPHISLSVVCVQMFVPAVVEEVTFGLSMCAPEMLFIRLTLVYFEQEL